VPCFAGKDPNPFFGRVLYTHGRALDQPLAITRFAYVYRFDTATTYVDFPPQTVALFWTAQGYLGNAGCGTGAAGLVCRVANGAGRSANMLMGLTALHFAYERPRVDTVFFQGSLLRDQRDATGTVYRRNRTYDPASGQFTQEDPIGVAGGLNRYGFADGDPVNFADPFGLCPEDLGGDGRRATLGDCPLNSKGWAEFNRRASGRVEDAGWGDPLLVAGGLASLRIGFGHGARHLAGTGLVAQAVERAIANEVRTVVGLSTLTGSWWGRIVVGGRRIEYRAHTLTPTQIHVGTYYPKP
jgi:RHS repeat-associated protein